MASDDEARQREVERNRLIDEIRRRAEEAELKRIEDEEHRSRKLGSSVAGRTPDPPPPSSPPAPSPDARIAELREKLEIALDRGLAEKAEPLLIALRALLGDDPSLAAYEQRLAAIPAPGRAKSRKKQPDPGGEDTARDREARKRKVAAHLEQANTLYQQEKYDRALAELESALVLDPGHEEVQTLKAQVERARELAEKIREEEMRRKAAEGAKPHPVAPVPPKDPGSVWGEELKTAETQTVFEDPEEKAAASAQAVKPSAPLVDRLVQRASTVHIPVKTVVTAAAVIVVLVPAYLIIDAIRSTVFPPKYSLLVFPATSNVTDGSQEYLSEGITEGLIADLSAVRDFRLLGPTTSFHFTDPRKHTAATARALGVSFYVTWNVDRSGEAVAIQASLYDTVDAAPRWTMTARRSLHELPALRQEMARALLAAMEVELPPELQSRFAGRAAAPPDAQEVYLRARYLLRRAGEGLLDSAIAQFELARALDPSSAETQSGLGWAYVLRHERQGDSAALPAAQRSVQLAVAADPSSAEASRVWALAAHFSGDHAKALERMEEAVRLAPADAEATRWLALLCLVAGRTDDALRAAETARSLDPFNVESFTIAGLVRNYRGQLVRDQQGEAQDEFAQAQEEFDAGQRLASDRSSYAALYQADILVYRQQHDRAIQVLTDRIARMRESPLDLYRLARVMQSGGKPVAQWQELLRRARALLETRTEPADLALLALVHTRLGEFQQAAQRGAEALARAPQDPGILYAAARMNALQRGNEAQALTMLTRAVDTRYSLVDILDMDFFNLRTDPGFLSAVTR